MAVVGLVLWSPTAVGVFNDDGVYALLGRALARGEGLRYAGVVGSPPAPKFPPLYPLLLAAIWKVWPSFPANAAGFKALNLALAAGGSGLFAVYLMRALGVPAVASLAMAVGAWLTVDVWRYAAVPLSEPLFVCTLVLALVAATRVERGGAGARVLPGVAAVAALAATYYTRTIGIVLVPALVLACVAGRRWKAGAAMAVAGAALIAPWILWTQRVERQVPGPLADILGTYGGWLGAQLATADPEWAADVARGGLELGNRVLSALLPGVPAAARWALAPLLVAAGGAGAAWVWRRSRSTVLFIIGFLAVLWLWPYSARRLLAPVVPWLVVVVGAGFAVGARARWQGVGAPSRVLGFTWAVWFVAANAAALAAHRHDAVLVERSLLLLRVAQGVRIATPRDAVVGAPELWAGVHLYTGRTVAPSARFRPASGERPVWGTAAEQIKLWRTAGIDFLVLELGGRIHQDALLELQRRCGREAVRSAARFPGGEIVRLDWRTCGE